MNRRAFLSSAGALAAAAGSGASMEKPRRNRRCSTRDKLPGSRVLLDGREMKFVTYADEGAGIVVHLNADGALPGHWRMRIVSRGRVQILYPGEASA